MSLPLQRQAEHGFFGRGEAAKKSGISHFHRQPAQEDTGSGNGPYPIKCHRGGFPSGITWSAMSSLGVLQIFNVIEF
jgi:hypothetical protein